MWVKNPIQSNPIPIQNLGYGRMYRGMLSVMNPDSNPGEKINIFANILVTFWSWDLTTSRSFATHRIAEVGVDGAVHGAKVDGAIHLLRGFPELRQESHTWRTPLKLEQGN